VGGAWAWFEGASGARAARAMNAEGSVITLGSSRTPASVAVDSMGLPVGVVPSVLRGDDSFFPLKGRNNPDGDCYLRSLFCYVYPLGHDQPVKVGFFDDVFVVENVVLEADVGKLLDNMGAAAAQPDYSDGSILNNALRIGAQEGLPRIAISVHVPPRKTEITASRLQ